jgi:hypothetical protein
MYDQTTADRLLKIMAKVGVDPIWALTNHMCRQATKQWADGNLGEVELIRIIRNVAILSGQHHANP